MKKKPYCSILTRVPYKGQSFEGIEHMTEPDQSMSIREMIERFGKGLPVNVKVYDEYGEDDEPICEPGDDYFSVANRFSQMTESQKVSNFNADVNDTDTLVKQQESPLPQDLSSDSEKSS